MCNNILFKYSDDAEFHMVLSHTPTI